MDRTNIFKSAHARAKVTVNMLGGYRKAFQIALKEMYKRVRTSRNFTRSLSISDRVTSRTHDIVLFDEKTGEEELLIICEKNDIDISRDMYTQDFKAACKRLDNAIENALAGGAHYLHVEIETIFGIWVPSAGFFKRI
jgi:hypothetical protein